jgi:hypothetical protein
MADERYGIAKRQHPHRLVIVVLVGGLHFLLEGGEDQGIPAMKNEHAHKEAYEGPSEAAAIISKCPVSEHDGNPQVVGKYPRNDVWLLYYRRPFELFQQPMEINAVFGLAFLNIEVAFEIMVFCFFGDLSKGARRRTMASLSQGNLPRETKLVRAPVKSIREAYTLPGRL